MASIQSSTTESCIITTKYGKQSIVLRKFAALSFLLSLTAFGQPPTDRSKIQDILTRVQETIRGQQSLSYSSSYTQIASGEDDSVISATAKIWLTKEPADTIFGFKFRISGSDKHGVFDYYYDGEAGYEIRHKQKSITLIYPSRFPNDEHNPAKVRMASVPMLGLLTDSNITKTLLLNPSHQALSEGGGFWKIELVYPPNKFNQLVTRTLTISQKDNLIVGDQSQIEWAGPRQSMERIISGFIANDQHTADSTAVQNPLEHYTITQYAQPEGGMDPQDAFVGKEAPGFSYPSLEGSKVTLSDFRGKYVLLDFWESWCGACILSMPEVEKLHEQYSSKGLVVLGITTENKKKVGEIMRANKLGYTVLAADPDILALYKVNGRPNYFLIDSNGIMLEHSLGGDHAKIERIIQAALH